VTVNTSNFVILRARDFNLEKVNRFKPARCCNCWPVSRQTTGGRLSELWIQSKW
jgi:hypothetical protein